MSHIPKKAHWPPYYIYIQTACIALAAWFFTYARFQDDAYISLVYARSLISGNGLTWDGQAIEGYSNFLFILCTSLLGWLGIDLVLASTLTSFAGYFGMLLMLHRYTDKIYRRQFGTTSFAYAHSINRALCFALAGSSAIVLVWCFGGLEPVFYAMLLTAAVCMILLWLQQGITNKHAFIAGILFALATMTRMEAIMIWGISGLFLGFLWLRGHGIKFSHLLLLAAGFLLLYAPYTLWRVQYFGEFLPNTYYAKLYGMPEGLLFTQGLFYFLQFAVMPPMLVLFALVLLYLTGRKQLLGTPISYLGILVSAYCFYIIKSGGDHMSYLRFFVPVVPLLALLIYHLCSLIIPRDEKRFRDVCGALIVLLVLQFGMIRTDEHGSAGATSGEMVADYVNQHWPHGAKIALNPVGALPYFAPDYHYIDMLGLMDTHIARRSFEEEDGEVIAQVRSKNVGHQKGDGAYVISQKPDYIIFGNAAWGSKEPIFLSDSELAELAEFKTQYVLKEMWITPPKNLQVEIKRMAEKPADPGPAPVINEDGKLRFIYFERRN